MRKRSLLSNMLVNKQLEVGKYNNISALGHSFLLGNFPHLELVQTGPVAGSSCGDLAREHVTDGSRSPTVPNFGVLCPGTTLVPVST